jgi:hypothetical protein
MVNVIVSELNARLALRGQVGEGTWGFCDIVKVKVKVVRGYGAFRDECTKCDRRLCKVAMRMCQ